MERVGASGRIRRIAILIILAVLIILTIDHDIVKGGPWSEGVFDVFLTFLCRFCRFLVVFDVFDVFVTFLCRFCVVFVVLGGGPWSEWGG